MKRNILLILLIVCLITIVLQSCENDNNNDKETNERIPPGPPLHFIPMSTVVNSQFLLSPLIPTREIALPLATLQDEDYGEYDCILRNVNTTTNRLSFNVKYYRCSPAYIKELDIYDQDLDYDYDIYTVLFSVTLIGDAPFESFEITEVTLEFNYQEVKVPVSIKIYDRRN
ncbi:MAG: hypothetical protein LBF12_06380, partial [Christensenellaceae bacterium]|nr:hypothetical protein [Christensenellaceae bacterium]